MTQPEEVTAALLHAIAEICEDNSVSEQVQTLRLAAVRKVYPYVQTLHEGTVRTDVILTIFEGIAMKKGELSKNHAG